MAPILQWSSHHLRRGCGMLAQSSRARSGTPFAPHHLRPLLGVHLSTQQRQEKQHNHRYNVIANIVAEGDSDSVGASSYRAWWDKFTERLVGGASLPFSVLVIPQVISNFNYMAAGNTAALAGISWEGWASGVMGNTLMLSHFASSGERNAMFVQLVGICNGLAVLSQVAASKCMPMEVFVAVLSGVLVAVSMSVARIMGRLPDNVAGKQVTGSTSAITQAGTSPVPGSSLNQAGKGNLTAWQTWQLTSGVIGMSLVPQVFYRMVNPADATMLPGLVTLGFLTLWFSMPQNRRGSKEPGMGPSVEQLPGLASTVLFAIAPLPQLYRNFFDPTASLAGLSVLTMLLGQFGNMCMLPRAFFVQDPIWIYGGCWALFAGWATFLSMYLRISPATGAPYVDPAIFAGVTAAMAAYSVCLTWATNKALKGSR